MNIIHITDPKDPGLELFTGLSETKLYHYNEPDEGIFIAESAYVILRALEAGYAPLSILVEDSRMEAEAGPVFKMIREKLGDAVAEGITVYTADTDILSGVTGYALVRGLWAAFKRKAVPDFYEFCKDKSKLTVLFDVVNPTNVGAIIRSAAALGMDGAVLTYASVDPLTRRSSRVSMGTVFQLPWTKIPKEGSAGIKLIRDLKTLGYKTVAMALTDDSVCPDDKEMLEGEKLAVIMGTEGDGLPKEVISECDYRVKIPMMHGVDSLNVAAASAVIFWEICKQAEI
ncbi:MAG: RNA methyltransferase [Lachnospiraceae bacterium]|nr:RNA methyltransferase [Lachnospiraceae bacterium]MBR1651204.1 RNA methyltransferase [Lachnospiraceae bacterium]